MVNTFPKPTIEQTVNLLSYLPTRPDYNTWLIVVSVVANYFDSETAEMILKTRFLDEVANEHSKKIAHKINGLSYGALVNIAKDYGLEGKSKVKHFTSLTKRKNQYYKLSKSKYFFLNEHKPYYRFKLDLLEEIASIYEYDFHQDRFDVEQFILNGNQNIEKERIYMIAVNRNIRNKNMNVKSGLENNSFYYASSYFKNEYLSFNEIITCIGNGFSIILSNFKTNEDGFVNRNSSNWISTELLGIDVDGSMTIEDALKLEITQKALMIYTTVNHTLGSNRFRVIFDLPILISDIQQFNAIVIPLIKVYNADKNCKDVTRIFYGNDNTTVYNIRNSKIMQFQSGNIINEDIL